MRRKILMGVLALALPAGTMAFTQTSAFATKAPPNPVSCTFSATVTVSPALSAAGTASVKGATGTTTVHGTYSGCTTSAGSVPNLPPTDLSIISSAAKDPNYLTDGNGVANKKTYYLGLCAGLTGKATLKSLGKAVKNLAVSGGVLKGMKAGQGAVGSDVGFLLTNGTVKGGTYPTAAHGASILAGLTNDTNNTNLIGGCLSGPVTNIDIDSAQSTVVL